MKRARERDVAKETPHKANVLRREAALASVKREPSVRLLFIYRVTARNIIPRNDSRTAGQRLSQ